jgi:hypothetical protein
MIDGKKPAEPKTVAGGTATSVPKITRRRFTKAGAVAPVIMTLASRPVWGQACSFSGQLSGNDYATAAPPGGGLTPRDWLSLEADSNLWPPADNACNSDTNVAIPMGDSASTKKNAASRTNDKTKPKDASQPSDTSSDLTNPILAHRVLCYAGQNFEDYFSVGDIFSDVLHDESSLKAHIAAAVLNILSPSIEYGYKMDGLIGFLDSAAAHPIEALAVLRCLNGRGVSIY